MELQALSMGTTKRVGIYGATRVMLTIYVYMPTYFFPDERQEQPLSVYSPKWQPQHGLGSPY